jgi:hypothetical protein
MPLAHVGDRSRIFEQAYVFTDRVSKLKEVVGEIIQRKKIKQLFSQVYFYLYFTSLFPKIN